MSTYSYRRDLKRSDWIRAIGIGAGAGVGTTLVATYLATLFLRRMPLVESTVVPRPPSAGRAPRP